MSAFAAAARELVRRVDLHDLSWRHHGLGMLQADVSSDMRIHVWHPELRVFPREGFRDIHDHRCDITSAVVWGCLEDTRYFMTRPYGARDKKWLDDVAWLVAGQTDEWKETECWQLEHSPETPPDQVRVGCYTANESKSLGHVLVKSDPSLVHVYEKGEEYTIPRRVFHTSNVYKLTITVVHRWNFDDKLARVLGSSEEDMRVNAFVKDDLNSKVLRNWVLREACYAVAEIRAAG